MNLCDRCRGKGYLVVGEKPCPNCNGSGVTESISLGAASDKDMLALIEAVREKVRSRYNVELEEEVVVWKA